MLIIHFQVNTFCQLNAKKKIVTVVIDPGHGGKDPGTHGLTSREKDVALAIALKVGNYIKKYSPDVKVVYTRETDIFIPLSDRAPIAIKNHADLFISIHANANPNTKANGMETYAMGLAKTDGNLEVAKKENAVILIEDNYRAKYDGYDPKSSESFIIFSLVQNLNIDQSLSFATYVQTQLSEKTQHINRGVKQAGFLVLWKTTMPSVLIEVGFLSNPEEEKYVNSEHGSDAIANSIYKAFKNYKHDIETRSAFISKSRKDTLANMDDYQESDTTNNYEIKDTPPVSAFADTSKTAINFYVQICASKKPITLIAKNFKGMKHVEEIKIADIYKYVVGKTPIYKDILKQFKIAKNYFADAFIIAVSDGKIIPVKEALKQIKN